MANRAKLVSPKTSFVGPMPRGEQAPIIRDNVNTRRKERLATQREKLSGGKSTKDMSPEEVIKELRKARGMASRGRSKDGQKFGSSAGSRFVDSMASYRGGRQMGGYGGGYGNQRVPFGYIPGSPYNSMLGGGMFNIPTFDKRLLFGNGASFFANGGAAGADTIPAMLTPGEFVMNKGAVSKYGTSFMRSLNKGKVQGFNKGGAVQYRQEGGGISGVAGSLAQTVGLDTSKIEGVFGGFVDNFSSVFDNILAPFSGLAETLKTISDAFGNFTMDHKVNVEGMISLGGLNVETIKNELSKSIGEMVGDEVQRALKDKNNNFKSN